MRALRGVFIVLALALPVPMVAAVAVLGWSSPAAAIDGYVQEPQEGEVYYVAEVTWNCWNDFGTGGEMTANYGPFDTHEVAKNWANGGYNAVKARNGLSALGFGAFPRVYVETDKKSWLHPVDLDGLLTRWSEYCLTGDTPD